ncbi:2,3-diaminopropionate biosynthesis protein SbnA [Streptomyces sp. NPDC014734]|uniref:2,3-diaminopropionate biosynthesis protein SbnA n=1 Tax=Streptomyces sp. NPDC014734 TaxID=3364886 RepID=UPI0036FA4C3A
MPIIRSPHELVDPDLYVDLEPLMGRTLYVKCEGLNFGGSIKMKAAAAMIADAERDGLIREHSILIESSSGNLGVALGIIAAAKGIPFTCVTDRRCNELTASVMRALGTRLLVVDEPDPEGGYLKARLDLVRRHCAEDDRHVWLNQYNNKANWTAHYKDTAQGILKHFPDLDVLFVGVGTAGTAMGCVRYFRDIGAAVRVVAIDAVGSVSFGSPAANRLIPGLGAGVVPPLLDPDAFDDVVLVPEEAALRMCRALSARGLLFGGSTGTVVDGARTWLERNDPRRTLCAVCISPDMGDRYLDTVYNDAWVLRNFGPQALVPLPDR